MQQESGFPSMSEHLDTPRATVAKRRPVSAENGDESVVARYRIRPEEFLSCCSDEERSALQFHLSSAIMHFLDRDLAVCLEGLGILFPFSETKQRSKTLREKILVHSDSVRTVRFEKCGELVPFHWEKFGHICETRDLAQHLYPHLPLALRSKWSEPEVRRVLRGYLGYIRREIVRKGHCAELGQIADFYALHNRQGRTENDWFAGADIFISPRYEQTLFIEPCTVKSRPLLENAWELLEAAFGPALRQTNIDLLRELENLGYDAAALRSESALKDKDIPVAVYLRMGEKPALIYCTDGLRRLSRGSEEEGESRPGNELIFQLALPTDASAESVLQDLPEWPFRVLTMGWILLQSARSRTIRTGAGLSCDAPLIPHGETELHNIFATAFACARNEQLATDRAFTYINLVGITADEAAVAARYSPEFLLCLLEYRQLDQMTKPDRSSIVARTGLLEEPTVRKGPALTSASNSVTRVASEELNPEHALPAA